MRAPDYEGGGLVNLIAEVELRLTGEAVSPRLAPGLRGHLGDADTYVLVLFDGMGDLQLGSHPAGARLRGHRVSSLDTSFSSQTSVVTATLATGIPPSQHGLIAYVMKLSDGDPVNTLWWFDTVGTTPDLDLESFLPRPNLAERMLARGVDAVVVEPAAFLGSPLDRVLYRGASKRGVEDAGSIVDAVLESAAQRNRLVVAYLPDVDAAGHAFGTGSDEYTEALVRVSSIWQQIGDGLPGHAGLLGIADHGMVDITTYVEVSPPEGLVLSGDSRVIYVSGDPSEAAMLAEGLPGAWRRTIELPDLWGPGPHHPEFGRRRPDVLIFAGPGVGFLYQGNSVPLAAFHGGLTEQELRVPLLVWSD